jgi:hypothetical protein
MPKDVDWGTQEMFVKVYNNNLKFLTGGAFQMRHTKHVEALDW